jgi:signal transduction histidine kinase
MARAVAEPVQSHPSHAIGAGATPKGRPSRSGARPIGARRVGWPPVRLTAALPIAAVFALLAAFELLYFPSRSYDALVRSLTAKAVAVAELTAHVAGPALEFDDRQALAEYCHGAAQDEELDSIAVYAPDGALYFSFVRAGGQVAPAPAAHPVQTSTTMSESHLRVQTPIRTRDGPPGTLVVAYSTRDLFVRAASYRRAAAAIALAIFALGLSVAVWNGRLFHRAKDAVRLREEFLLVASHELRTPLTSLMLASQSLASGRSPAGGDGKRPAIDMIVRQTRRLAKLVEDLLDVSRIEAGQLPLEWERVDLSALAREVTGRFADEAARAGSPLSLAVEEPLGGTWDRSRLDQVISNLLANAIKFGAGKPIEISTRREGLRAVLAVQDHGIGIDPEQLPHVFERFERGVSTRNYGGLGLGLYIARNIVERMGGVIRCESVPGDGARFVVSLPCG